MPALDPIDRDLLDFLCACTHHNCRVVAIKAPRRAALRRLRNLGFVSFESYLPSPSAMSDWRGRKFPESPPSPGGTAGEEQPTPKAAKKAGGAAARSKPAAPPKPDNFKCGHPRTPDNTRIVGRHRAAICNCCWREALRAGQQRRQERKRQVLERPFEPMPAHYAPADKVERAAHRKIAASRRQTTKRAKARIEQGLPANGAKQASVRHAQIAIEKDMEVAARLATPVEQAKLKLMRLYRPVVSMGTLGGDPALFLVGSKRNVTEAELLEMARRVAA